MTAKLSATRVVVIWSCLLVESILSQFIFLLPKPEKCMFQQPSMEEIKACPEWKKKKTRFYCLKKELYFCIRFSCSCVETRLLDSGTTVLQEYHIVLVAATWAAFDFCSKFLMLLETIVVYTTLGKTKSDLGICYHNCHFQHEWKNS